MRRTIGTAASLALVIAVGGCEAPSLPTNLEMRPSLSERPSDLVSFQAQLERMALISASCDQGVCEFTFQSTGSANIMGPITATGHIVQDFTVTPCNQAPAEIEMVGATGSITTADADGTVCPGRSPSGIPEFISSQWEVTGGTGAFAGIAGSGSSRGSITAAGPVVHLSGTVSY